MEWVFFTMFLVMSALVILAKLAQRRTKRKFEKVDEEPYKNPHMPFTISGKVAQSLFDEEGNPIVIAIDIKEVSFMSPPRRMMH